MTYSLAGQTITAPDAGGHGLDMSHGQDWLVEDCLIDLSACPLDQLDEAVGVVWGSSAVFRRCVIRGAGKLVLCGSGDAAKIAVEHGQTVTFEDCVLEDFGRRGPEAQSGMRVILQDCLIRNWGAPDRFDVRSFGAWAHHGGSIEAVGCVFDQSCLWRGRPVRCIGHAWHQARKAAGITRRITPYSLRHAMPTEALEHGADVKAVAEVMGHADPTMLLRVYQHTRYRLRKKAVNAAPGLKLDKI